MTSFALISVEKDYKVEVSEGKVTLGRGPYLQVTDKRVSRNHATLEVSGGSLIILPTHTNPTFYQACGGTKFEPLEKDEVKKLENGDCISFLPNDLIFKIEKKDIAGIIEDTTAEQSGLEAVKLSQTKDCNVENDSKVSEHDIVKDNDNVLDSTNTNVIISKEIEDLDPEEMVGFNTPEPADEKDNEDSYEDDNIKIEVVAQPLNKTRVLPNWMTKNKGKETKESLQKGKKTKKNVAKVAAAPEVKVQKDLIESSGISEKSLEENKKKTLEKNENKTSDENNGDEQSDTNDDREDLVETPEQEKPVSTVSTEEEDKKRKRDESEDEEQSSKREKKLPSCPYGSRCYRKNPVHFQEYTHEEESDNIEEEQDDLPECPYGEYCYRKNPRHRREYKHTPRE